MDKLLTFIKTLDKDARLDFFAKCGTTEGYVRKVACSDSLLLGVAICVAIEQQTGGKVTRKDMRPDDWLLLWPELNKEAA